MGEAGGSTVGAIGTGWAVHGEVRVHYLEARPEGRGPAVLIVPGFGEEAADHHELLAALAPRRAVAVDLRGRGPSTAPPDGYRLEGHVGDLEAAATAAGLGRVHVVTYSRGTTYGLAWALAHPDRVASITIGDYPAAQLVPPASWVDKAARRIWRGRPMTDRMSRASMAAMVNDAVSVEFWDALAGLARPVQVIRGGNGGMVDDTTAARYASAVADLRMVTFESSGHDLWSPDPQRFPTTVRSFLDEVDRSTR